MPSQAEKLPFWHLREEKIPGPLFSPPKIPPHSAKNLDSLLLQDCITPIFLEMTDGVVMCKYQLELEREYQDVNGNGHISPF